MNKKSALPELLAPAGAPDSLRAAVAAGADAVYFGTGAFNARMNAKNFDDSALRDALELCRAHGVRTHVTLNTQIYDREMTSALRTAEMLYSEGVDALIVADRGLALLIHEYFPDFELHASTQACGHNVNDAMALQKLGFSRMVCARELSAENIRKLVSGSPIDIEMFIHGALCVSMSGQCLFSSLVGGRSGNRGECAQPCRMKYNDSYPLSPKDLCLAGHIKEIIGTGVRSLKIEGRMKSPDYVYKVVSIYRRLLDEGRDADAGELAELGRVFSRSGFTDGFFTGDVKKHPNAMLGVRTDADKEATRDAKFEVPEPEPVKIRRLTAVFEAGSAAELSIETDMKSVSVKGDVPETAISRPMTAEDAGKQLAKLGNTFFTAENAEIDIKVGDGIMLPVSKLNELRRRAISELCRGEKRENRLPEQTVRKLPVISVGEPIRSAEFLYADQITERAREYFDRIYLPLTEFVMSDDVDGIVMPPAIYDSENERVEDMLAECAERAEYVTLSYPGQLPLVKNINAAAEAGYRFNINNSFAAANASEECSLVTLSPELTLPQMRDISRHARCDVIVYGRIPLMTTERCIIRAVSGDRCVCMKNQAVLKDRMGVYFPMRSTDGCRTVIYNSIPVYMADRADRLSAIGAASHRFLFTTETADEIDEIIAAYENGTAPWMPVRRIK